MLILGGLAVVPAIEKDAAGKACGRFASKPDWKYIFGLSNMAYMRHLSFYQMPYLKSRSV